jgi:rRNA maturation endonuclease Nob1
MNHVSPLRRVTDLPVRLRCHRCEVAWSGTPQSECWVCGEPGTALNTAVAARDHMASAFDLELLF